MQSCLTTPQDEQQRREKEEDAREQARLQAEQERLKQQFAEEKEAEKAKRAAESGVSLTGRVGNCERTACTITALTNPLHACSDVCHAAVSQNVLHTRQ